jgi:hypothetical protein
MDAEHQYQPFAYHTPKQVPDKKNGNPSQHDLNVGVGRGNATHDGHEREDANDYRSANVQDLDDRSADHSPKREIFIEVKPLATARPRLLCRSAHHLAGREVISAIAPGCAWRILKLAFWTLHRSLLFGSKV